MVQVGGTAVMATVCRGKTVAGQSFLPMTVDFRQKAAAAGRIPTNMLRRELGASEREVKSAVANRSFYLIFATIRCSPRDLWTEV